MLAKYETTHRAKRLFSLHGHQGDQKGHSSGFILMSLPALDLGSAQEGSSQRGPEETHSVGILQVLSTSQAFILPDILPS